MTFGIGNFCNYGLPEFKGEDKGDLITLYSYLKGGGHCQKGNRLIRSLM